MIRSEKEYRHSEEQLARHLLAMHRQREAGLIQGDDGG